MKDPIGSEVIRIPRLVNPIERSVVVEGDEYRILSPIVIDLERGVISFAVQRTITANDGKEYTVSDRVVLHDGIESKRVQLPNGKFTLSSTQVARFSEAWGILGQALKDVIRGGVLQIRNANRQNPQNQHKGA